MRKNKKLIVNRIDFDEKTAEPIIVEVSDKEILNKLEQEEKTNIAKADFFEQHKNPKNAGKQIVMQHLGIDAKEDATITRRQKALKLTVSIVFIIFLIGVFAFTIYKDFFKSDNDFLAWSELKEIFIIGWLFLLGALLSLFMCYLVKALKLSICCKTLTGKFRFKTCFETAIIGHYYNFVTPLAVGGQPFEIYHLSKHGVGGGAAYSLPITTYVLNQFALVTMGITFLLLFRNNTLGTSVELYNSFQPAFMVLTIIGLSLMAIMPMFSIIFSLNPRFGYRIASLVIYLGGKLKLVRDPKKATYKFIKSIVRNSQAVKKSFKRPLTSIACFLLSFVEHFAYLSIAYFTLKIFNFDAKMTEYNPMLEWLQIVQLVLLLNCAISFIPTPGNSGAADLSFFLLFAPGLAAGLAFPAMTIWRMLAFYSFIIMGFIFATIRRRVDKRIIRRKRKNIT
jgi:uncharacterized protein (TIRG00374 family)